MKFNSRIFGVALIPFYGYLLMCAYVVFRSHFEWEMMEVMNIALVMIALIAAGAFASLKDKKFHILALFLYLLVGGFGIRSGLLIEPMNWLELVSSAFVIAFGLAFYEMIEHHRSIWHEND